MGILQAFSREPRFRSENITFQPLGSELIINFPPALFLLEIVADINNRTVQRRGEYERNERTGRGGYGQSAGPARRGAGGTAGRPAGAGPSGAGGAEPEPERDDPGGAEEGGGPAGRPENTEEHPLWRCSPGGLRPSGPRQDEDAGQLRHRLCPAEDRPAEERAAHRQRQRNQDQGLHPAA